jgi:hypothetical protein
MVLEFWDFPTLILKCFLSVVYRGRICIVFCNGEENKKRMLPVIKTIPNMRKKNESVNHKKE